MTATNLFPIEKYGQTKQEMITARNQIQKEKAGWLTVRNTLDTTRANELDEQFKAAFEQLGDYFIGSHTFDLQEMLATLRILVQQGASAGLLGNYELGPYNLAMLIKQIDGITGKATLDLTTEIIRLTIVAGANLNTQKAYVGNGGSISLEWVCLYLAGGVEAGKWLKNQDQFTCCYTIFSWIIDDYPRSQTTYYFQPFNTYLNSLHYSPLIAEWQEKLILAMIYYGFPPFTKDNPYQNMSFFSQLAAIQVNWLFMLFSFEDEAIKQYTSALQQNVTKETAATLINAFTSNNKTRKHFKSFFSPRPHWLLRYIVKFAPEIVFALVKRNEQELLIPFLKNFKPALHALRDEQGNNLLHQAVLSRSLVENTIQLLRNSGIPLQTKNNEGLTPLALAMKNNKTGLIKLLK